MTKTNRTARKTKSATINRMLRRQKGATLAEIEQATSWQSHSCRAFLSSMRKKGSALSKEARPDGKIAYRIVAEAASCPA